MNKIIETIKYPPFLIPFAGGIIGVTLAIINFVSFFSIEIQFSILIALLSSILIFLAFERWNQHKKIEKKIEKLSLDFQDLPSGLQIPFCKILKGNKLITKETIAEIKRVKKHIRATSFKGEGKKDTPDIYYEELGKLIKSREGTIIYECCFNEGHDFSERKKAFGKLNFTDVEFAKMRYYQFQEQAYLNFLIFDNNVAFIGFPIHDSDNHMQTALKIKADKIESVKEFINDLIYWYDYVLKKDKITVNTEELLKEKKL